MCAAVAAAGFKSAACSHALLLLLAVPELCHLSSCLSGLTPPARIRKGGRGKKPHYGSSRVYRCNSGSRPLP